MFYDSIAAKLSKLSLHTPTHITLRDYTLNNVAVDYLPLELLLQGVRLLRQQGKLQEIQSPTFLL